MNAAPPSTAVTAADLGPVAFIGGGHMAASLIGGLLAAGLDRYCIRVAQRSENRATELRERFAVTVQADIAPVIADAALIVLAVKPQQMTAVLEALQASPPAAGSTVLSVAAGVRVTSLARALPGYAIVRAMPNTPALLRAGISGLYAPPETPAASRAKAEALLAAAGETCWVDDEAQLDAVTALSGCGPAYYFLLTELLRDAGTALGMNAAVASRLAQQTFVGAAQMAAQKDADVVTLRQQVTSKGGATEAALDVLESAGLRGIFVEALRAADRRARERGDALEASFQS